MKKPLIKLSLVIAAAGILAVSTKDFFLEASSHREAPLIANDPLADNTDLYAFRSPDDTNTVTIIANYVPFELPQGGPNYYSFGENIRYEIHIKNDAAKAATPKDDITYRFTFAKSNEDGSTFFNIRLGKENLKTTYLAEKSTDGGTTFTTIVTNGVVPPSNIGPRSITTSVGLKSTYDALRKATIITATGGGGENIFCGPADDPFFVDLGGVFDLGMTRAKGTGVDSPKDGLAKYNVHSIAIKIPIATLQKDKKTVNQRANILDSDFIIGVWASASRPSVRTLAAEGKPSTYGGDWIQVSRIGMPLTNEAVIPLGSKDAWNAQSPYVKNDAFDEYFMNPELALYMGGGAYGTAVPAFSALKIQSGFLNTKPGLFGLKGNSALDNTALADAAFGNYLLRDGKPRSVDLLPIFHTGVPNLRPYQLATGKNGNALAAGKPFINNFLPTFGDMLRLNMAVPVTPRDDKNFSSLGLIKAAALGLLDTNYNKSNALQWIPNMDGFPNGRRLEDDVTTIELQAVGGVVLAAIGVDYDTPSDILNVVGYSAGVNYNDTTFVSTFPYLALPWNGYDQPQNK